jgi:rRNA processing protein Gar1
MSMNLSDVVTVGHVASALGLTPAAIYLAIKEERVESITVLGRIVIPRDEFNRLKRQKTKRKNGNAK